MENYQHIVFINIYKMYINSSHVKYFIIYKLYKNRLKLNFRKKTTLI